MPRSFLLDGANWPVEKEDHEHDRLSTTFEASGSVLRLEVLASSYQEDSLQKVSVPIHSRSFRFNIYYGTL